jgi:predicted HTH transcriptional regulator
MIDKPAASITKTDIDALVESGRVEDRTIEYKRDLPGPSDEQRREFLRDVSSFANGFGGDILYGIEESGGVPTSAPGVLISNFDELRLQLQNSLRSNLDPRLPAVDVEQISGFPNGSVLLVRVHQSWRAPHMVRYTSEEMAEALVMHW